MRSCSTAAGRLRSVPTTIGVWWSRRANSASFTAVVVLPEPCSPTSITTVGGALAYLRPVALPPRSSTSSSCTALTTVCGAVRPGENSAPMSRPRTRSTNSLTTLKLTSASSSARRTSRRAASMSSGRSTPRPVILRSASVRRAESVSNIRPTAASSDAAGPPAPSPAPRSPACAAESPSAGRAGARIPAGRESIA